MVVCKEDCGNSPKKSLLKELITCFANGMISKVVAHVSDDIVWKRIGVGRVVGIKAYALALDEDYKDLESEELVIENILTHGNVAAANGTLTTAAGKSFAFCHVYVFMGASARSKVKEITTYSIELEN
jgi:hypothetical protein